MKRRIFISTGEVSGDWHGAILAAALKEKAIKEGVELELVGLGGNRMADAGVKLLGNTVGIGSIGAVEALPYVIPTLRVQALAKRFLRENPPDVSVLIDYMMPNQGIGYFVKRNLGTPVVYYIAPQEWVWSFDDKNTRAIAAFTDKLLAIFPQEAKYYEERGTNVEWVGHPFVDLMAQVPSRETVRQNFGIVPSAKVITLVPASRTQELRHVMPVILQAAQIIRAQIPEVKFLLPLSLERYRPTIENLLAEYAIDAEIISGKSQEVIRAADLVLTKSGTVNLETALLNVPQVVLYRVTALTAWLGQYVLRIKLPFISPVNLVNMEAVVPEFLQDAATPEAVAQAGLDILLKPEVRANMLAGYERVRISLGAEGAIQRVADAVLATCRDGNLRVND
jgi:lipid-A-disaccharide synthase